MHCGVPPGPWLKNHAVPPQAPGFPPRDGPIIAPTSLGAWEAIWENPSEELSKGAVDDSTHTARGPRRGPFLWGRGSWKGPPLNGSELHLGKNREESAEGSGVGEPDRQS